MRSALFLLLAACTGSPDEFNVSASHNTAAYDRPDGSPAFDESGYSASLGFTWYLPTTAKRREEERDLEMIALLRGMERNTHDLALAHPVPEITVEAPPAPPPDEKKDPDATMTLQIKGAITLAILAIASAITFTMKGMLKNRGKLKGMEQKTHLPKG